MVRGEWSIPKALERMLSARGRPIPSPVQGLLLLDTGASHTCIGAEVAHELGLSATSFVESHGAGGWHKSPEFFARLTFRVPVGNGHFGTVAREYPAASVPALNDTFEKYPPPDLTGVPTTWRLIGLIGRDLLRNMVFRFDGPACSFSLTAPT